MILKPTMAEQLSGIGAGLDSILPDLKGPSRRQVQMAVMFLRRLALRAGRFDEVLRQDSYDLSGSIDRILELLEDEGEQVAGFREAWRTLALPLTSGLDAHDCPAADYFIAHNLDLQALLVEVQDFAATLADGASKKQVKQLFREFHERTLRRDLGLIETQ